MPASPRYRGYHSFDYLDPSEVKSFRLAPERNRVDEYPLGLSEAQHERVLRIMGSEHVISLHEHPKILTEDPAELASYNRTGRNALGFEGLAHSGMTALFDNFMNGTNCVTSENGWKWDDTVIDLGLRFADIAQQDYVFLATTVADLHSARETGRIALVAGLEAATSIENELDRIDVLYGFGVRQMGIAYSQANQLGSGLAERSDGGLTNFGRKAVRRMNDLGIAIDVSHSSDRTSDEVIAASDVPVFITHAGSRTVWNSRRMKSDETIKKMAERGGVIGIEAAPHTTLSEAHPQHSLESVMDHFAHCVDLVGIDHVAFGPDTNFGDHVGLHDYFDAQLASAEEDQPDHPRVRYVAGVENPAENFYNIIGWLIQHDYSDAEIAQVTGKNILRVLEEVWR